jgi:hypothetical protein
MDNGERDPRAGGVPSLEERTYETPVDLGRRGLSRGRLRT